MTDHTLYIHIGPTNTGTTALQTFLDKAAPTGLRFATTGQWGKSGQHYLAMALAGHQMFLGRSVPTDETIAQFDAEMREARTDVIVSSEAFGALIFQDKAYPAQLKAHLGDHFSSVLFIFTLRHPMARAASFYKHLVCTAVHGLDLSPRQFLERDHLSFMLDPYLRLMDEAQIAYQTIHYEPSKSFVPRFLSSIGHPLDDYQMEMENVSQSDTVLAAMLCVNRLFDKQNTRFK
ncbi:MAG: hypothetical protein AAFY25_08765, partial [Pseudomonadota bacterium]